MGFLLQFSLGKMRRREKFHLHASIQNQHIFWHRQNTIGHKQIACPGVQHLLHLKSKSKILRPIEIMGFFYEFFCQIQENSLL